MLGGGALAQRLRSESVRAHSATRLLMGTLVNLTVVADAADHAQAAIDATFGVMTRLIGLFDHRQPDSALARLNRDGHLDRAPMELLAVLKSAIDYGDRTGGAFDVTVKPLLDARKRGEDDPALLTALRDMVDYRHVTLRGDTVRLGIPGAAITLDGIAKGRVIDAGIGALQAAGYGRVVVEAGGDLRTLGARADGTPWRVGIAHPRANEKGGILAVLPIGARAMATSGDYMHAFTNDFSQHHIIDPRTGQSPSELASATVLAATAQDADALGTALMVLGADAGLALAERLPEVEALLITKDMRVLKTSGVGAVSDALE